MPVTIICPARTELPSASAQGYESRSTETLPLIAITVAAESGEKVGGAWAKHTTSAAIRDSPRTVANPILRNIRASNCRSNSPARFDPLVYTMIA